MNGENPEPQLNAIRTVIQDGLCATEEIRRAQAWYSLRQMLSDIPALRRERDENLAAWQDALDRWRPWINQAGKPLEAQLGVMQLLLLLDGKDIGQEIILPIATGKYPGDEPGVDLRSWALYYLRLAGMRFGEPEWTAKYRACFQSTLNDPQAKVRQWAAFILGQMAQDRSDYYSRLEDEETRADVERLLTERWECEIDAYVARQLVISLGQVGGWAALPNLKRPGWRLIAVLRKAADHPNQIVSREAPNTAAGVADTIRDRHVSAGEKAAAFSQLLDLVGNRWLSIYLDEHRKHWKPSDPSEQEQAAAACQAYGQQSCRERISIGVSRLAQVATRLLELDTPSEAEPGLRAALSTSLIAFFSSIGVVLKTPGLGYETYREAIQVIADFTPRVYARPDGEARSGEMIAAARTGLDILLQTASTQADEGGVAESVRERAAMAIRTLVHPGQPNVYVTPCIRWLAQPDQPAQKSLIALLSDGNERLALTAAEALTAVRGDADAADLFVRLILEEDPDEAVLRQNQAGGAYYETRGRRNAALALARVQQNDKAYKRLVESLKVQEGAVYDRARYALRVIGDERSIQDLIAETRRRWLENRYFQPIEDADQHGRRILDNTVWMSRASFIFTLLVAGAVVIFGSAMLFNNLVRPQPEGSSGLKEIAGAVAGALTAIAGLLLPFFWNPSQRVQETNVEIARVITAFHAYIGRVRLLGLGFASQYADGKADINFLTTVSNAVGDAMLDSTGLLSEIGQAARAVVETPDLVGKTWEDAAVEARAYGLTITFEKLAQSDKPEGQVVEQKPAAKTPVQAGSKLALTLSKGS